MTLDQIVEEMKSKPYMFKQGRGYLAKRLGTTPEIIMEAKKKAKALLNTTLPSVSGPRILILDIETAPMQAYVWKRWKENISLDQTISEWFMICWSAKWLGETDTFGDCCIPDEIQEEDDMRICYSLWNILNEADIVIAHNGCVEKDTPILMKDFTWKKAGELIEGDEIIAFEEGLPPGVPLRDKNGNWQNPLKRPRQLQTAKVTHNHIEKVPCVKVKFTNGYELITTPNHPWLMKSKKDNFLKWRESQDLKEGDRVVRICAPWTQEKSYEEGWMSGFIEGEGSLIKQDDIPSAIQWCQRPTVVKEKADSYADLLGINRFDYLPKTNWGLGKGDCIYTNTLGGKWEVFKWLGKLNLQRLKSHIDYNCLGSLYAPNTDNNETETYYVQSVEPCGYHEIAALSTSTSTYIADGFAMHNCKFDIPMVNSRFAIHGFLPPSPYKQIDTLDVAKRSFKFSSNKLDALAGYFNIEHKDPTDFKLWKACMEGSKKALDYMFSYNKKDVEILEKVYLKIRPWIKNHPNLATISMDDGLTCPICGGHDVIPIPGKFAGTSVSQYQAYRCRDCFAIVRGREKINDKVQLTTVN